MNSVNPGDIVWVNHGGSGTQMVRIKSPSRNRIGWWNCYQYNHWKGEWRTYTQSFNQAHMRRHPYFEFEKDYIRATEQH
jgi:hypothetical protein